MSAINPVGPAGQPTRYAVGVSNTGQGSYPGLVTFVDFSGDTVLSTPSLLTAPDPTRPLLFAISAGGGAGFLVNAASSTMSSFALGNPTGLRTENIVTTTLPAGGNASAINIIPTQAPSNASLFLPEPGRSAVALLNGSGSLLQEIAVTANPVWVVGNLSAAATRVYALSQGSGTGNGVATAIETSTTLASISNVIPVGAQPVYGVTTADGARTFVVNKGSGTVTVINSQQNTPDATTPTIPAAGTLGTSPVWATLIPSLNEIAVLNQGNGTTPGTVSIISIPTCNVLTQPNNPLCNSTNINDAAGFGTVIATIPVGVNPTMMDVLSDSSRLYIVNSGNAAAAINGSVSVVNLSTNTVTATIPGTTGTTATSIYGHPDTISVTYALPTGKVYVTSPDSQQMTILRTDTDSVDTHVAMQGAAMRVLVTAP